MDPAWESVEIPSASGHGSRSAGQRSGGPASKDGAAPPEPVVRPKGAREVMNHNLASAFNFQHASYPSDLVGVISAAPRAKRFRRTPSPVYE